MNGLDNVSTLKQKIMESKIIGNTQFDNVWEYHGGFAVVRSGMKLNFINRKGNVLCDTWFDYAAPFRKGYATVQLGDKYNFVDREGKLVIDTWFDNYWDCFVEQQSMDPQWVRRVANGELSEIY